MAWVPSAVATAALLVALHALVHAAAGLHGSKAHMRQSTILEGCRCLRMTPFVETASHAYGHQPCQVLTSQVKTGWNSGASALSGLFRQGMAAGQRPTGKVGLK